MNTPVRALWQGEIIRVLRAVRVVTKSVIHHRDTESTENEDGPTLNAQRPTRSRSVNSVSVVKSVVLPMEGKTIGVEWRETWVVR
jgi:hypothetical protein